MAACVVGAIRQAHFFLWSLRDIQCAIGHPHLVQLYHVVQMTQNITVTVRMTATLTIRPTVIGTGTVTQVLNIFLPQARVLRSWPLE